MDSRYGIIGGLISLFGRLQDFSNTLGRSSVVYWRDNLSARLYDSWYPPRPNYQRVRYICACGKNAFLDAKELSPGGLGRFQEQLVRDGLANVITAEIPTADVPSNLAFSPSAERRLSTSSRQGPEYSLSDSGTKLSTPSSYPSSFEAENPQHDEQTESQYLLLCIYQNSLPVLVHVDCCHLENDNDLFREILNHYHTIRKESTWKTSFLLPLAVSTALNNASTFLEQKMPNWLKWLLELFQSLSEISTFKIDSGDFVQFELVPVREVVAPIHFECAQVPPSSEVDAGNYLYDLGPMTNVVLASIPLWHLTQPGQHSDKYWVNTFPKKLRNKLVRTPGVYGRPVIGWGIRINECFNWNYFLFLLFTVSILIGAIVGTYVTLTSDPSSAFGLGAFLAAIMAIYIPYQYFTWESRLD